MNKTLLWKRAHFIHELLVLEKRFRMDNSFATDFFLLLLQLNTKNVEIRNDSVQKGYSSWISNDFISEITGRVAYLQLQWNAQSEKSITKFSKYQGFNHLLHRKISVLQP